MSTELAKPMTALEICTAFYVVNVGDAAAACDVYVGRTMGERHHDQGWGNPHKRESKAEAIVAYFDFLQSKDPKAIDLRRRIRAGELEGKVLGCWCAPEPCHAIVLAGLAAGLVDDVKSWVEQLRHG